MKIPFLIALFSIGVLGSVLLSSCTKEFDCKDKQIAMAFTGFTPQDIDTLIIKKYKQNNNYQLLIDSIIVAQGRNAIYSSNNDTTIIYLAEDSMGIRAGFDWRLYIPAKSRMIEVSDIVSEKKTGTCNLGIINDNPISCSCTNAIFSLKMNNSIVNFEGVFWASDIIYIQN